MKPAILIILLSLLTARSHSQEMFGLQGGLGRTTSYQPEISATFGLNYFKKIAPRIFLGASLFYEHYSLFYNGDINSTANITQNCAYMFFAPKLDFCIDQNEYIHLFFSLGPGILLSGSQTTSYGYYPTGSGGVYL